MKHTIKDYLRPIISDRYALVLTIILVLVGLVFMASIALSIRPTELQVVTHYTGFGLTNFYRDKWYYLISFVVFGLLFVVMHIAIACKLYVEKGRMLALGFLWFSVALLVLAWFIIRALLNVANLI